MADFKVKDYTQDSDINSEMMAKTTPINDFEFTDNIAFEGQNEIDSFTPTVSSKYQAYTYDGQGGFYLIDGRSRVAIVSLTANGLFFQNTNEIGAGAMYPFGVAQMGMDGDWLPGADLTWDLGSGSNQWNNIYCGTLHESSDRRLKDNIAPINHGLESVMKLKPVQFDMAGRHKLGFIAQDVHEVIPEVTDNVGKETEMASMRYQELIPVLVKAMHEQQAIIEDLQTQVEMIRTHLVI